jgi:glucose/arabinose dehydrogenase
MRPPRVVLLHEVMRPVAIAAPILAVVLLAGCASAEPAPPTTTATPPPAGAVQPVGTPETVVEGLAAPWSMVRMESGSTLISERDSARVLELTEDGSLREVGVVPGVVAQGEGGLLGLEVLDSWLYAYFTADADNRVVRFELTGDPGSYGLGGEEVVLEGLAKAGNHNGGRIEFGPDGKLYVTVGDAGDPSRSQDQGDPNGKILRIEADGAIPSDNPFADSPVYSMGHRNPQGIAWDDEGQLWAAEFGQDTWDELNRIKPGGNYGWPIVEGIGGEPDFIDPVQQWPTDAASPSGLAFVSGTLFMAGLGGERLWAIYPGEESTGAVEWFTGEYGRLRDAVPGPDGSLWVLTNNTDGRGSPRQGDDRIIQVQLGELVEG